MISMSRRYKKKSFVGLMILEFWWRQMKTKNTLSYFPWPCVVKWRNSGIIRDLMRFLWLSGYFVHLVIFKMFINEDKRDGGLRVGKDNRELKLSIINRLAAYCYLVACFILSLFRIENKTIMPCALGQLACELTCESQNYCSVGPRPH